MKQLFLVCAVTLFSFATLADSDGDLYQGHFFTTTNPQEKDFFHREQKFKDMVQNLEANGWHVKLLWKKTKASEVRFDVKPGTLEDLVVHQTEACKKLDNECISELTKLNAWRGPSFDLLTAPTVTLPCKNEWQHLEFWAGRNYVEDSEVHLVTLGHMSKKLYATLDLKTWPQVIEKDFKKQECDPFDLPEFCREYQLVVEDLLP